MPPSGRPTEQPGIDRQRVADHPLEGEVRLDMRAAPPPEGVAGARAEGERLGEGGGEAGPVGVMDPAGGGRVGVGADVMYSPGDLMQQVLDEAGKFVGEVIAPLNRSGDEIGAQWSGGAVTMPPGFRDAYQQFWQAGWPALSAAPDDGGQGLPAVLESVLYEWLSAANHGFTMAPGFYRDRFRARHDIDTVVPDEAGRAEVHLRLPTGSEHWLHVQAHPLPNEGARDPRLLLIEARDASLRRQTDYLDATLHGCRAPERRLRALIAREPGIAKKIDKIVHGRSAQMMAMEDVVEEPEATDAA